MTRVLTYNILLGGNNRVDQLYAIIDSSRAEIVGLVEATRPHVIEELAQRLNMQYRISGQARTSRDWQVALLSRLPIVNSHVHTRPGIFGRRHLLEVELEQADGTRLVVFLIHLTSSFFRGPSSNRQRRREVTEMLRIMAPHQGTPHLVMGDFNTLSANEEFKFSALLHYFRARNFHNIVQPKLTQGRRLVKYWLLWLIIKSPFVAPFADRISRLLVQGGIDLICKAGYIDCFRRLHQDDPGFTYHSALPACRIDYIFASPQQAARLISCEVVTHAANIESKEASDHMPLCAEFRVDAVP